MLVAPLVVVLALPGVATAGDLRYRDSGRAVASLQRRLVMLGYLERGEVDGVFGDKTWHAVVALQGWEQIARDGVVGPRTRWALRHARRPQPWRRLRRALEIDLTRQVLLRRRTRRGSARRARVDGSEQVRDAGRTLHGDPSRKDELVTPLSRLAAVRALLPPRVGDPRLPDRSRPASESRLRSDPNRRCALRVPSIATRYTGPDPRCRPPNRHLRSPDCPPNRGNPIGLTEVSRALSVTGYALAGRVLVASPRTGCGEFGDPRAA